MDFLPETLVKLGKPAMRRKALIKKLGELMMFRQTLNLNRENYLDVPDFYWTEPELEGMFSWVHNLHSRLDYWVCSAFHEHV